MGLTLPGRRALVTGASGGIGSAIARALHRRGVHVLLSGRRFDALESLSTELGSGAEVLVSDLAEDGAARELAERAGGVDVLVANAALASSGTLDSFSPEELDRALDVNLRAPMHLAHALAPGMVERGAGHMVFVSSFSGKVATVGSSIYSAAKFGVRGFAFGVREDLRGTGVGVTTVFPGFISGEGMFAEAQVRLPPGVTTRTPVQVADAVIRGIETDRAEVDVAPVSIRAGALFAGVAPSAAAAVNRRLGSARVAADLAAAQRHKR